MLLMFVSLVENAPLLATMVAANELEAVNKSPFTTTSDALTKALLADTDRSDELNNARLADWVRSDAVKE